MHSGLQVWLPTAACRMNKQSVATGAGPELMGWPHGSVPGSVVVVIAATGEGDRAGPGGAAVVDVLDRLDLCRRVATLSPIGNIKG